MDAVSSKSSTVILLLCSLAIPLLIWALPNVRAGHSSPRRTIGPGLGFALFVQELFVASEIALLAGCVGGWFTQPLASALAGTVCILLAHVVVILDYMIRRRTGVRFAWHFLSYLKVLKCFQGSIQRGGMGLLPLRD